MSRNWDKISLELKHLAPYLPYGLSFSVNLKDVRDNFPDELRTLKLAEISIDLALKTGKPILRPLSSMSLEEIDELNSLIDDSVMVVVSSGDWVYIEGLNSDPWSGSPTLSLYSINKINEYLLSKHFDVFNLIDKGLAIAK